MRINRLIGVLMCLGMFGLQAQTSYHACQRSVGLNGSSDPLAYSSYPGDTDNIANMWWSTGELNAINGGLTLVGSDLNSSSLPIVVTQDQKFGSSQSAISNVQMCHKKSYFYEKTVPLTTTDFELYYCGKREHPVLTPTMDKEYADRKCAWLYQHKATSRQTPTPHDVQTYVDNVVEKITGQRPNRHHAPKTVLTSEKINVPAPEKPALPEAAATAIKTPRSPSPVPSSGSGKTSPTSEFPPISGELIL